MAVGDPEQGAAPADADGLWAGPVRPAEADAARMRTLILDDDMTRHAWLGAQCPGSIHVTNVPSALELLEQGDFDRIFLDHDLGTEPAVGRDVAKWLIAHPEKSPNILVIIQSVNAVSGPKIERELLAGGRAAFWQPFPNLQNDWERWVHVMETFPT